MISKVKTKKSLGQNFLKDSGIARKIAEAGEMQAGDLVLEIGPGEGILTEQLLKKAGRVIAVEKDDSLFELLKEKFSNEIKSGSLVLVHNDILKLDFKTHNLESGAYKLIANIPYYITGAILRKFLTAENQPELMALMLQKEVAERIVVKKEKPLDSARGKESILSISVKIYGQPKIAFRVRRGAFRPAPKVDSAVLVISDISRRNFPDKETENNFFKILRAGFAHPRKKLSSNLRPLVSKAAFDNFDNIGISENARAEELSPEQWLGLAKML